MSEYIKKEDALKVLHDFWDECIGYDGSGTEMMLDNESVINSLPTYSFPDSAENKGEWIPITTRPMTEEEKEAYRGEYDPNDMTMYDCQMPEDGQEVLVTTRYGDVDTDTFYHDDGWYFETFCDDGDVLAWQPLPEPYKGGNK